MAETSIGKPKVPGAGGSFKIAGKKVPKWALFAGAGGILAVLLFQGKKNGQEQGEFNQEGQDAAGGLLGLFEELLDMYPDPTYEPELEHPGGRSSRSGSGTEDEWSSPSTYVPVLERVESRPTYQLTYEPTGPDWLGEGPRAGVRDQSVKTLEPIQEQVPFSRQVSTETYFAPTPTRQQSSASYEMPTYYAPKTVSEPKTSRQVSTSTYYAPKKLMPPIYGGK